MGLELGGFLRVLLEYYDGCKIISGIEVHVTCLRSESKF